MLSIHAMGNSFTLSPNQEFKPMLRMSFVDSYDDNGNFTADVTVEYLTPTDDWRYVSRKEIEKSSGTYEIKGDKLYILVIKLLQKLMMLIFLQFRYLKLWMVS